MPNQHDTTWCHFFDQSHSPFLKPKYETVWKRLFHWLILYPGWRFFLCFEKTTEQSSGTWWPARSLKWLLWYVCGHRKCLRAQNHNFLHYSFALCFFCPFCFLLQILCAFKSCAFPCCYFAAFLCSCFGRCCAFLLAFPPIKPVA